MKITFKKYFAISIVCLTMFAVIFSLVGCDKGDESPRTADVSVFLVDKNDNAIANTEIVVEGISDMDIANIYATDSDGKFNFFCEKILNVAIFCLTFSGIYGKIIKHKMKSAVVKRKKFGKSAKKSAKTAKKELTT